jgi:hypothetical protein
MAEGTIKKVQWKLLSITEDARMLPVSQRMPRDIGRRRGPAASARQSGV